MRARLQYVVGQGWHCGRLLLWPVLLLAAMFSTFILAPLQLVAQALLHTALPVGLLVPAGIGMLVARRLRRKRAGEPFTYDPLPADATGDWDMRQVSATSEPALFRRLYHMELLMWGTALALQAGLLLLGVMR